MTSESIPRDNVLTAARPTFVRWGVLVFLATLALLLYVDRVCIGQAAESIKAELKLDDQQMGWVFSAFILAYCLFEVPTGHWGDRHGSRGVITRVVIWWSIFTALTGATFGLYSLIAVRFLFGAGEAGAYPNVAIVITKWFPLRDRGKARGIVTTVSLLGSAAAPVLAGFLITWIGWRWTFAVFGSVGIVWAAAFYWWFVDLPTDHPQCNDAEVKLIAEGQLPKSADEPHERIPWKIVLTSPNTWFLGTIMICSATLFYTQFQWFPTYLKQTWLAKYLAKPGESEATEKNDREDVASDDAAAEARKEDSDKAQKLAGLLTGAMMIGGAIGCLSGGFVVDALTRRTINRRLSRKLVGGAALSLAALSMLVVPVVASAAASFSSESNKAVAMAVATAVCNGLAGFCVQIAVPTWWTAVAEISGKHGAAMWGLMNSMGGLGVVAVTSIIGWYVDYRKNLGVEALDRWNPVFVGVGLILSVGAVFWLLVDTNRSIVERNPT